MRVLVTTDTIGGVWIYTRELVTGLVGRGIGVTLVSFGDIPTAQQTEWLDRLPEVDYRATAFRLEWMRDAPEDQRASAEFLTSVVAEVQPDLLHLSQYCYGSLNVAGLKIKPPRIVVAHSDVLSWWAAVRGEAPPQTAWLSWYRDVVKAGLANATAVVAPSQYMLDSLRIHYSDLSRAMVIHNGRDPRLFSPHITKDGSVLSVGRLWDAAKQVTLLTQHEQPVPVCIVGSEIHPEEVFRSHPISHDDSHHLQFKGPRSEGQLRLLYARAAMYAATSRYEPFGLAPVEAALSRCAIIANDIPTFRELWGEDAIYFRPNDADSLTDTIRQLSADIELRAAYGLRAYQRALQRFTAERMVDDYLELYKSLVGIEVVAA
jgi:glycogen synthase